MKESITSLVNELLAIADPASGTPSNVPDWVRLELMALIRAKGVDKITSGAFPTHADVLGMLRYLGDACSASDDDPLISIILKLESMVGRQR
ncbi:MAG: hypothetical protein WCH99_06350 [Verrucomicrobiota bacterium]